MENFKISENILLALLGKGMVYELEDMDMEYNMKVPMDSFSSDDDDDEPREMTMNIKMNIGKLKMEIQKG